MIAIRSGSSSIRMTVSLVWTPASGSTRSRPSTSSRSAREPAATTMRSAVGAGGDCEARLAGVAEALFRFTMAHEDLMRLVFATLFAAREEVPADAIDPARRRA